MFNGIKASKKDNGAQIQPVSSGSEPVQKSAPLVAPSSSAAPVSSSPLSEMDSSTPKQDFATPELIKKDIIKKVDDGQGLSQQSQSSETEEKIYVMPKKFNRKNRKRRERSSNKTGSKKRSLILFLIAFFILLIAGVIYFYFWAQKYYNNQDKTSEVLPEAQQEKVQERLVVEEGVEEKLLPKEDVKEEIISKEQTLRTEIKDGKEEIISWIELYLPAGAIDPETQIGITGNLPSKDKGDKSYNVIGPVYQIAPADGLIFLQTASLNVFYHQDLVEEEWEGDIGIGYFKDDLWMPLSNSTIDVDNNIISVDLDFLPSSALALIIEKSKIASSVKEFQIAPNISSSADDDNDGLTNIEEAIFGTEIKNPDSDADSVPDGQEILTLMDPLTGSNKIATSGIINIYTNPTFAYSFFYPASWLSRAIPETNNQEILVITNTGEFFSVTVENNPEKLNLKDWYLRQAPGVNPDLLLESIVNNQPAVWSQDHLTIYIGKKDKVYILSYMIGASEEANFKTTFQMLINSFQFIVQPKGRADGTLIKYPNKPEIYLIENNKKRAFKSGEIFEKLGFKWEDVIEIPIDEVYPDGPVIESLAPDNL